jgi:hypothetical protein
MADGCRRMHALASKICDDSFMKTSIDIPEMELSAAMRFTKAKTKKAAIVTILADFNQRWRRAEATKVLGTSTTFMTRDELMKARCARRSLRSSLTRRVGYKRCAGTAIRLHDNANSSRQSC